MKRKIIIDNSPSEIVPSLSSNCENCMWYAGNNTCVAFKDGIPNSVWMGKHDEILPNQTMNVIFKSNGPIL